VSAERGYERDRFRRIVEANKTMPGRKKRLNPVEYDDERYKKG
jgi:hypothetical protein